MRLNAIFKLVGIFLIICILCNCDKKRPVPDVSKIKVDIKVLRFEKDLFAVDFEKIGGSIPFFCKKYGEFFDIFSYKILQLGDPSGSSFPSLLKGFITDYNINQIIAVTDTTFADFSSYENGLNEAFRYCKYYFPKLPVPKIITYVSGFNQTIVSSDTILGIGLDKYLGSESEFYRRMQLSAFVKSGMYKQKIVADCMRAWAMTQFPMNDSASNLLSNIIYQGKLIYFTQLMLPKAADSLVFGLNEKQMKWCAENEEKMWTFLVEYKMLFKTDYFTINKFIGDGPFTKDFGPNSPAKAVYYIGWKIVNSYFEKHPEQSVENLMQNSDYQRILRLSKYKP